MLDLIGRLLALATEATKLAEELASGSDRLNEVLARLNSYGLTATHAGHIALEEGGLCITGAESFERENLLIRPKGDEIEFSYQGPLQWLALSMPLKGHDDVLLSLKGEVEPNAVIGVFARNIAEDGTVTDGERSVVKGGVVDFHRLIRAAPSSMTAYLSSILVVVNSVSSPFRFGSIRLTELEGASQPLSALQGVR